MLRPTWRLRDSKPPADLHYATPLSLRPSTSAVVGRHAAARAAHDVATDRLASRAGLVAGTPSTTAGSRAVQR